MVLNKDTVLLQTGRFDLKILNEKDVSIKYVDWLNDVEINQFLETRFVKQTLETCTDFVKSCYSNETDYLFGIFAEQNGVLTHIGNIKLGLINWTHLIGDISYFIGDKNYWGKGAATEVVSSVVDFGFNQLGLKKICAGVYEENLVSLRVLRKCNFFVEGFLESHVEGVNGRQGIFKLGILNDR